MWALGAILYFLHTGEWLNYSCSISLGELKINLQKWSGLKSSKSLDDKKHPEMFDFMARLLQKDQEDRLTCQEALNHPWL